MALIHVPVPWKRKPPLGVPKSHSHQLAQGLKAHWVMNEGGGATLADLSSSGNPGELTNGAAWTSGRTGPVVACDGSDAYILGSIDCTAFTALTISAWIKP